MLSCLTPLSLYYKIIIYNYLYMYILNLATPPPGFSARSTILNFQVNVGCVPKKVMFNAAVHAEYINEHSDYGFDVNLVGFDWK